jgi:hypothetical protein
MTNCKKGGKKKKKHEVTSSKCAEFGQATQVLHKKRD